MLVHEIINLVLTVRSPFSKVTGGERRARRLRLRLRASRSHSCLFIAHRKPTPFLSSHLTSLSGHSSLSLSPSPPIKLLGAAPDGVPELRYGPDGGAPVREHGVHGHDDDAQHAPHGRRSPFAPFTQTLVNHRSNNPMILFSEDHQTLTSSSSSSFFFLK